MDFDVTSRSQVRTLQGLARRKPLKVIAVRLVSSFSLRLRKNASKIKKQKLEIKFGEQLYAMFSHLCHSERQGLETETEIGDEESPFPNRIESRLAQGCGTLCGPS